MEDTSEKLTRDEKENYDLKAVQVIVNILTEKTFSEDCKLNVLQGLRHVFTGYKPDVTNDIFNSLHVESLLDILISANKEYIDRKDFFLEYGNFLLKLTGKSEISEKKINSQLVWVIKKLLEKEGSLDESLTRSIWLTFEQNFIVWPNIIKDIIPFSNHIIEERIFEWIIEIFESNVKSKDLNINYFIQLSSESKEVFQIICRILNQFVIMTKGNSKTMDLVNFYVTLISENCEKIGKSIISFYPRKYCHLIALLIIAPEILPVESNDAESVPSQMQVLQMLFNEFKEHQYMISMLLTHYPKWLNLFTAFFHKNKI